MLIQPRQIAAAMLACVVSVLLAPAAPARQHEQPAAYFIKNVQVVDVEAGRIIPRCYVTIIGEHIRSIVPGEQQGGMLIASGGGAIVTIDGSNLYLVPGLFDAHVHYVEPESFGRLMIANGVTFVRELGSPTAQIVSTRDQLNRGELLGPEMIVTGAIIDGKPPVWPFSEPCETPDEARAAVRRLHDAGVDQIKVYSLLRMEVYEAAVNEAHALGLKAVGHLPGVATLDDAAALKQDSIEHLMGIEKIVARLAPPNDQPQRTGMWAGFSAWDRYDDLDKDALRAELIKIRNAGITLCPTVVVMKSIARVADDTAKDDPMLAYVPTPLRSFWETAMYGGFAEFAGRAVPMMTRALGDLHAAGIPMMVGTDLANPYVFAGFAVHEELALFQQGGIPAADALRAATIVPARFCGVADRLGTVAEGKTASLVLTRKNPLEDIRNASEIEAVFLKGRYFDRAALDSLLQETKDYVKASAPAPEAANAVKLELPGEVVRRGRYKATFGRFDAGVEDFLITKADDGYHVMSHSQPKGGFQPPSVVAAHAAADFTLVSATWRQFVEPPVEITYTPRPDAGDDHPHGTFIAAPSRGGEPLEPQTVPMPARPVFSGPVSSFDFITFNRANLEPGESKTFDALGFGFPDWKVQVTPLELTRLDDTPLKRPEGEVQARHYRSTLKTPMGAFNAETWTDEHGVPLKSVMTMPFGTVTVELQ